MWRGELKFWNQRRTDVLEQDHDQAGDLANSIFRHRTPRHRHHHGQGEQTSIIIRPRKPCNVGKREKSGGRELTSSGVSFFTEIFPTEMCRWQHETTRTAFAHWSRSRSRVVRSTTISARQHGTGSSAPWWTPAPSSSGSYHLLTF